MKSNTLKILAGILAAVLIIGLVAFTALKQYHDAERALPPRTFVARASEAQKLAGANGYAVLGTGSMAPYIPASPDGCDPLITIVAYLAVEEPPFSALKKGDLVSYQWMGRNIVHQLAERSGDGWIPSGLHNESYDQALVTEANFRARVIHTYVITTP